MIRIDDQGPVRVLTIDRPEARNALSHAALDALASAVADADRDADCRAVVLTGEGAMFAAGGDLRELRALTSEADALALTELGARVCQAIMCSRLPFIAALGGAAIGGGAELALACDLRVMGSNASICFKHARMGVTSSWGVLPKLVATVGPSFASRLLLLSLECNANEALRVGLADAVVGEGESLPEALRWALECAKGAPQAVSGLKALITAAAFSEPGAREREVARFVETWTSADHREAVEAFFERRPPVFGRRP